MTLSYQPPLNLLLKDAGYCLLSGHISLLPYTVPNPHVDALAIQVDSEVPSSLPGYYWHQPLPSTGRSGRAESQGRDEDPKIFCLGTPLVVQWLRVCLPKQGTRVRSLVMELRSHMPWGN